MAESKDSITASLIDSLAATARSLPVTTTQAPVSLFEEAWATQQWQSWCAADKPEAGHVHELSRSAGGTCWSGAAGKAAELATAWWEAKVGVIASQLLASS